MLIFSLLLNHKAIKYDILVANIHIIIENYSKKTVLLCKESNKINIFAFRLAIILINGTIKA